MTENKRFTFDEDVNEDNMYEMGVFSDNGNVMETIDVLNCLNELHEENQELQGMYDAQKQLFCQLNSDKNNIWQDYQDLKKENEQLKQEIETLHEQLAHLDLDEVME